MNNNPHPNISIKSFAEGWLAKSKLYDTTTILGVFDQFFSLFVLYNALYSKAADILEKRGLIKKGNNRDRENATRNIIKFIGQSKLSDFLRNEFHAELQKIIGLLGREIHVHSDEGKITDAICIENINQRADKYSEGALDLIYQTRCNMFHGDKHFINIQMELLLPMNAILFGIIDLIMLSPEITTDLESIH